MGEIGAGPDALAIHPGVDFDVDGERLVAQPGGLLEGPDDGCEAVLVEGGNVLGEEAAHDEDAGVEAGGGEDVADADALGGVGDAEPAGSGTGEDEGATLGSVAVGVGLDDGEDGGGGAGRGFESAVVGGEAFG